MMTTCKLITWYNFVFFKLYCFKLWHHICRLDIEEFVDEIVYENEDENSEDIYDDEDDENG